MTSGGKAAALIILNHLCAPPAHGTDHGAIGRRKCAGVVERRRRRLLGYWHREAAHVVVRTHIGTPRVVVLPGSTAGGKRRWLLLTPHPGSAGGAGGDTAASTTIAPWQPKRDMSANGATLRLAGGDPLGETAVGLRVHMLVRAKLGKEQQRGRRAEKRTQRKGRQLKVNQVKSLHKLDKLVHRPPQSAPPQHKRKSTKSASEARYDGGAWGWRHRGQKWRRRRG